MNVFIRCLLWIPVFLVSLISIAFSQSVGSDGSLSYSIPIEVLPGTSGMEPKLSIDYNSQGGDGMLGMNWQLSGLPVITRMNYGKGMNYDGTDTYVSQDGRLIGIMKNEVETDAIGNSKIVSSKLDHFQSEQGSLDKYIPHGSCGDAACYWEVKLKDGNRLYFGLTEDSRIEAIGKQGSIRVWAISKVEDRNGNFYEVKYYEDTVNGDYYPHQIIYTKGNGLSTFKTVEFEYETKEDHYPQYAQSARVDSDQRLHKVMIQSNELLVLEYQLSYQSSSRNSYLSEVKVCDALDNCRLPHQFTWSEEKIGFGEFVFWEDFRNKGGHKDDGNYPLAHYKFPAGYWGHYEGLLDMNGDGLPDRVIHHNYKTNKSGIHVALNTGNGFGEFSFWEDFRNKGGHKHMGNYLYSKHAKGVHESFLDMNGDRLVDRVFAYHDQKKKEGFFVALNTGNGFEETTFLTNFRQNGGHKDYGNYISPVSQRGTYEAFLDMNGDGFLDRVIHRNYKTDRAGVHVALNTGNGFQEFTFWKDFLKSGGNTEYERGNFIPARHQLGMFESFLDMNGDGLPDRVIHKNYQTNKHGIHVALNTGNGFEEFVFWRNFRENGGHTSYGNYFSPLDNSRMYELHDAGMYEHFMDINGDGLPDRVIHKNYQANKHGVHVALNTGKGFEEFVFLENFRDKGGDKIYGNYPDAWTKKGHYEYFIDMNGDGLPDRVIHKNHQTGTLGIHVALNQADHKRIIQIQTPQGGDIDVEYTLSSKVSGAIDHQATSCGGGTQVGHGTTCGIVNARIRPLVTRLSVGNGRGQIQSTGYNYYNDRMYSGTIQKRKNLGFEWMKETDERTGIQKQTFFRQDIPFQGQILKVEERDIHGNLMELKESEYIQITGFLEGSEDSEDSIYLILSKQQKVQSFERGVLVKESQMDLSHDAYGFLKQNTTQVDNQVIVTKTQYNHDIKNWILGEVTEIESKEQGVLTRWEKFTYDAGNLSSTEHYLCPKASQCNKDSGTWVTTLYTYNEVGELISQKDIQDRVIYFKYDSLGQLTQTEVLQGETAILTRKFVYTQDGKVKSIEHHIHELSQVFVEQFEYDPSGRLTLKVFPDGTNVQYHYNNSSQIESVDVIYYDKNKIENKIQIATYEYEDARGLVTKKQINSSSKSNQFSIDTQFSYTDDGLLKNVQTRDFNKDWLQDLQYEFDSLDNITQIRDVRSSDTKTVDGINTDRKQRFLYDNLNRLKEASGVYGFKQYSYDAVGNVLELGAKKDRDLIYNHKNQLISSNDLSFKYSATGAMTQKVVDGVIWDYQYTTGDLLTQVFRNSQKTLDITYDEHHQRFKKVYYKKNNLEEITTWYISKDFEIRTSNVHNNLYKITRHIHVGGMGKLASITTLEEELPTRVVSGLGGHFDHVSNLYNLDSLIGLSALVWYSSLDWFESNQVWLPFGVWLLLVFGLFLFVIVNVYTKRYEIKTSIVFSPFQRLVATCMFSIFFLTSCATDSNNKSEGDSVSSDKSPSVISALHEPGELAYYGSLSVVSSHEGNQIEGPVPGTWFYHQDYLGRTSLITDARGQVAAHLLYLPFGELDVEHSVGSEKVIHTFTDQDSDEESGLIYYNARYYDPSLARFITADSIDSIVPYTDNLQDYHHYIYASNNPIKYTDPTGGQLAR